MMKVPLNLATKNSLADRRVFKRAKGYLLNYEWDFLLSCSYTVPFLQEVTLFSGVPVFFLGIVYG